VIIYLNRNFQGAREVIMKDFVVVKLERKRRRRLQDADWEETFRIVRTNALRRHGHGSGLLAVPAVEQEPAACSEEKRPSW